MKQIIRLVEDNPDHADLVIWALQSFRIPIRLFGNGESFLRVVEDIPGCLLLDLVLPGMNGVEVLEKLRARRIEIPTVCLSPLPDTTAEARARKNPLVVDVLAKPVDVIGLRHAVALALAKDEKLRQRRDDSSRIQSLLNAMEPQTREVLRLLLSGWTNREAAAVVGISLRSVERRRAEALKALGCRNVKALAAMIERADVKV